MEMVDALPGGRARVGNQPEAALGDAGFTGELGGDGEQATEHLGVGLCKVGRRVHVAPGNQQKVSRRLRVDVVESKNEVVIVDDVCRDLATDEAAKQAVLVGHGTDV